MLQSLIKLNKHIKFLCPLSTSLLVAAWVSSCYNLKLSDEQQKLQLLARSFARQEITPAAAKYDKSGAFPWLIVKKAHRLGLMNGLLPKEFGGKELSVFDSCLITEELAWGCTGITMAVDGTSLGQTPVIYAGNREQKKKYLGRLIEEPLLAAFAVSEADTGADVSTIKLCAEKKGNYYLLNGDKMWVTNGGVANWYFVLARTSINPKKPASEAFTAFIVDADIPGLKPSCKLLNMGQRASDTCNILFEDVCVPKENVLIGEGCGYDIAMRALDTGRATVAAGAIGLAQRAMDEALCYAVHHQQFGKVIAHDQTVKFKLADMAMGIDQARMSLRKACYKADNNSPNVRMYASMAKCCASDICNRVAAEAVQIFGENGFNNKYPVEKLIRDAKIFEIFEGSSEIQKLIITNHLYKIVTD